MSLTAQHRRRRAESMLHRFSFFVALILAPTTVSAQGGTQRGATLGGLAGAVAGGLIGDNNGEAGAGAAIGGVIGAVTGGMLGNAADKDRAAYQQQQAYLQQQQAIQAQASVSVADVVTMTRSGLSDSVIINQIQQRGVSHQLQVPEIISLHQQGVREPVITAMQQALVGTQRVARVPQGVVQERIYTPAPVIVEERYVVPHYPPPRARYYYRVPPYRHHHGGIHVRF